MSLKRLKYPIGKFAKPETISQRPVEQGQAIPLDVTTRLYAWHGKHHLAHITEAKKRMDGW